MRYLIVNGDDFGLTPGVNRGILEAHRRGVLTSTSLMVGRPGSADAIALARANRDLSVGLHLDLADAGATALGDQFVRFEHEVGRPPTHVDSHRDLHLSPEWLPQVIAQAASYGVPVRGCSPVVRLGSFYGRWNGRTHPEQISVEGLIRILHGGLGDGVTELVCHPGYVDGLLASSYAGERETELETLCDHRVREAVRVAAVRLIGFRDVPGLLDPSRGEGGS